MPPTGRSAGSPRACANGPRWRRPSCPTRRCSSSTNPSTAPIPCNVPNSSTCSSGSGEGRTVIVSSHVLVEVERMTHRVVAMVDGRLAAVGRIDDLRAAMTDKPRQVTVDRIGPGSGRQRDGDRRGAGCPPRRRGDRRHDHRSCHPRPRPPHGARAARDPNHRDRPADESMEQVFRYLVESAIMNATLVRHLALPNLAAASA
jgi:hypothetical protein